MTTNRPLRVFLCHSSADKPAVRELYQKLRAEPWIDPWLDEEELFPGMDWNLEIEKAIRETDAILVCLSKGSITKEGYVQREIKTALDYSDEKPDGTVYIIPIRLEECKPPERLVKWQYADYFVGSREQQFQRLLVSLKRRAVSLNLRIEPSIFAPQDKKNIQSETKQSIESKKTPEVKKSILPKNRPDHHTALASEQVSMASSSGVRFVVGKLQWGKNDYGYSLHAEPTSSTMSGMQTTDFLDYLGFKKETCQFATSKVCYAAWIDSSFDLLRFSENFGEAFVNFSEAAKLLKSCGHELHQPEGWEYFNRTNTARRDSNSKFWFRLMKGLGGGDGHSANRVENMKQSEDDDFIYRLSWIEKANDKGWVFHYQPKAPDNLDVLSIINFLGMSTFNECPLFNFEPCYWMFVKYQTKSDDIFEGNADVVHRFYDSQVKNFSSAIRMLIKTKILMAEYGFSFLET